MLSFKSFVTEQRRTFRRPGEISKHAVGSMGTRPATESPKGEMAKEYSYQKSLDKRRGGGDAKERYEKAKQKVKNLHTQSTSGRSVKVKRKTDRIMGAIARDAREYKGKNWSGD